MTVPLSKIINQKFGKLTPTKQIEPQESNSGEKLRRFLCKCECGNEQKVLLVNLRSGNTQSCGCWQKTQSSASEHREKHGMYNTPTYRSYQAMKQRCYNNKLPNFRYWGGRGIKVCQSWLDSFENFFADMGERPEDTSIDRINNNGDYHKENCRWATRIIQNNNQSNSKSNCVFNKK